MSRTPRKTKMLQRSFHIIYFSIVASLLHACGSVNLPISPCETTSKDSFTITEIIERDEVNRLSDERLADLKSRLISQINTSLISNSQLVQTIEQEESKERFLITTQSKSFGSVTNPSVIFCKFEKNHLVIVSVSKKDFFEKLKQNLKNKIILNQNTFRSFSDRFDNEKYTYNKLKLTEFEDALIEVESFYEVLLNYPNILLQEIKQYNFTLEISKLRTLFNELSRKVNVFDQEITLIDAYVEKRDYKRALQKITLVERLYDRNSTEGMEIRSRKNRIYELSHKAWKIGNRLFYKGIAEGKFNQARKSLEYLETIIIDDLMASNYSVLRNEYVRRFVKFEEHRLLKSKPKKSEVFFGLDFSGVSRVTDLNFDRLTPSFTLGLSHNFSTYPRLGVVTKYRYHPNKSFLLERSSDDTVFTNSFNEVSFGLQVGFLEVNIGKALATISEIDFITMSGKISLFRGEMRGFSNYIHIQTGFDLLHSQEYKLFNISLGINYHLRFNRKLNRKEKNYIASINKM